MAERSWSTDDEDEEVVVGRASGASGNASDEDEDGEEVRGDEDSL